MSHIENISRLTLLSAEQRLPTLATMAVAFAVMVTTWDKRRKTRVQLAKMPPHLYKDIGLNPVDAHREATKPFWQQ